jgi:hypothetical protein
VLLLSQNYKELARQLGVSEDAFKKNTALTDVSAKRFDTFKNKLKVLGNNFKEAGYDIASGFLPALGRAADKLTAFLQKPENVKLLKSIGTDLGKALDKVNFDKLLGVAKGLAQALDPALKIVLKIGELIAKLPPQLIGAGGGVHRRRQALGRRAVGRHRQHPRRSRRDAGEVAGGADPVFGKAFVQPVFVTNPGFGGGGGIPGGVPGRGGLARCSAAAKLGATAGAGIVVADMHAFNNDIADRLEASGTKFGTGRGMPPSASRRTSRRSGTTSSAGARPQSPGNNPDRREPRLHRLRKGLVFPASRDMDKNLATAAQALTTLKTHGINLQAIAGARLLALGVTEKSVKAASARSRRSCPRRQAGGRGTARGRLPARRAARGQGGRDPRAAVRGQREARRDPRQEDLADHVKTNVNVNTSVSVSAINNTRRPTRRSRRWA